MVANLKAKENSLYEQDFCLWLENTAQLLKNGKLSELDLPNLIEEVEAMGRSEKNALTSNLKIVLMHLLKYRYQSEKRSNSWLCTIFEHRDRLDELLQTSPSLKNYFAQEFDNCYTKARKKASLETGLPLNTFPEKSPFTQEEVLDSEFLPE